MLYANLSLFVTVSLWGLSFASAKHVLNTGFPPLTLAFLRFSVASAIIFPLQRLKKNGARIEKRTLLPLLLSSLFGITLYFFFETQGIRLTSASNASLIIACIPIFTIFAEFLLYKKAVGPCKIFGIVLSVGGVYLIVSSGIEAKLYPGVIKGNFFMMGACLCWVGYIMTSSRLKPRYSGIQLLSYQFIFGTGFLFPLALFEYRLWTYLGLSGVLNILYLGVFCSAGAYLLYLYGLSRLEPVVVSTYTNLVPVIGTVGGVIILHERLLFSQVTGGAAIIAGIFLINLRRKEKKPPQRTL